MTKHMLNYLIAGLAIAVGASWSGLASAAPGGGHGASEGFAFGAPGKAAEVSRTVEIIATDNEFSLPEITVKNGETVRFVIRNEGEFLHEFNIGMPAMHAAHQEAMVEMMDSGVMTATGMNHDKMKKSAGGGHMMAEMKHDDPNAILIEPGKSKELLWKFSHADDVEFACNVPGHYESGMMGPLRIGAPEKHGSYQGHGPARGKS